MIVGQSLHVPRQSTSEGLSLVNAAAGKGYLLSRAFLVGSFSGRPQRPGRKTYRAGDVPVAFKEAVAVDVAGVVGGTLAGLLRGAVPGLVPYKARLARPAFEGSLKAKETGDPP